MPTTPPYNQIFIVDDTEVDLFISKKIIEAANFAQTIQTFQSGEDALEALNNKTKQGNQWPELFFVDIRMPEMDGFEFILKAGALQPQHEKSKFVLITTEISDAIRRKVNQYAKIFTVLKKPFSVEDLNSLTSF